MKKVHLLLFVFILVLGMTACGKNGEVAFENSTSVEDAISENVVITEQEETAENIEYETSTKEETEQNNESEAIHLDEGMYNLNEDLKNGVISEDQYVLYKLYDYFGDPRLDNDYKSNIDMPININKLIEMHFDELSVETLQYYLDKISLKDIVSFDIEEDSGVEISKQNKTFKNPFVLEVQAQGKTDAIEARGELLDKVIVSRNGNFVIWYSSKVDNAVSDEDAKKIGEILETNIVQFENLTGLDYAFKSQKYKNSEGEIYRKQKKILKNHGYDESYLNNAMQVYIASFGNEDTRCAFYYQGMADEMSEFLVKLVKADKNGSVMFPYIFINRDNYYEFERIKQVTSHEFFHHMQTIIIGESGVGSGDIIKEATANWFSAKVNNVINGTSFLNEHASDMIVFSSEIFTYLKNNYEDEKIGYLLFPYIQMYEKHVSDGINKIIESIKEPGGMAYLEQQSTQEERIKIMEDLTMHNLEQKASNGVTLGSKQKNSFPRITSEIAFNKKDGIISVNKNIEPIHIDYHRLTFNQEWLMSDEFRVNYSFNENISDTGNLMLYVIGEKENKGSKDYSLISTHSLKPEKEDMKILYETCRQYDAIYFAVSNASITTTCNYSLHVNMENIVSSTMVEGNSTEESLEEEEITIEIKDKIVISEEPLFELEDVSADKMITESEIADLIRGLNSYDELVFCIRVMETKRLTQLTRNISSIQNALEIIWHEPILENVYSPLKGTKYSYDVDELNRIFNAMTTDRIFEENIPEAAILDGNVITFTPCNSEPETKVEVRIIRMYYDEVNNICIDFNFKQLYNSEGTSYREGTTFIYFTPDDETGEYKCDYLMEYDSRTVHVNE